jgi:hypothetical protein
MHPGIPDRQAFFAAISTGSHILDLIDVCTMLRHNFLLKD